MIIMENKVKVKNTKNNIVHTTFWYVFSGFLSKGIVFLLIPFYTRLLTKVEYGIYSNLVSWIAILSGVLQMNLGIYVIQKQSSYRSSPYQLLTNVFYVVFMVSACIFLPILIFPSFFASLLKIEVKYILVLVLYSMIVPCFYIYTAYFRAVYKTKEFVLSNFLVAFLAGALSLAFLYIFTEKKLDYFILAQTLPYILFGGLAFLYSFFHSTKFSGDIIKGSLLHGLPSIPHLLSITLISQIDKVMIFQMVGDEETAIFHLASTFTLILTTLTTAFNNAYVPWFVQQLRSGESTKLRKASSIVLIVFAFIILMMLLVVPEAIFILGGNKYKEATLILPLLLLTSLIILQYQVYLNVEYFLEKRKVIAYATVFVALFKVISNFYTIKLFGYQSVTYTTFFSYLLLLIIHIITLKKLNHLHLINQKTQWLIIVALFALMPLIKLLFPYPLVRYGILLILLLTAFFALRKRKTQLKEILIKS